MEQDFVDIISAYKKPSTELLKKVLAKRDSLPELERDFITYIAGFSHHEFVAGSFAQFGLSFLKCGSVLFDSINREFHVKILINDQTLDFESISLEAIAQARQTKILENRIQFRDQSGTYIDSLSKLLRSITVDQARDYLTQGDAGIYEDIVSLRRKIGNNSFVLHCVRVSQRNILINLKTLFTRVTASIFVNFSDKRPNLSLFNLRNKTEIHSLLKSVYWYVIDIQNSEEAIDFLEKIKANFILISYKNDDYNYFQDILLDIEAKLLECISRLGE